MEKENKKVLTPDYKDLLMGLTVIDADKTHKFYPVDDEYLKENNIPKSKAPFFECQVLNKPDMLRFSGYLKRMAFLNDEQQEDFYKIISNNIVNWGNIYDNTGELLYSQVNCEKLTIIVKIKIGNFIAKISGLSMPEKLALK